METDQKQNLQEPTRPHMSRGRVLLYMSAYLMIIALSYPVAHFLVIPMLSGVLGGRQ